MSVHSNTSRNRDFITNACESSLPKGWEFARIGDVIESLKYGTSIKCDYECDGVPVLRIPNIGDGLIDKRDLKYGVIPPREFEQLRLRPGDLLTIRSNGSVSFVGKTAVVCEAETDFAYAGYLMRLRPDRSMIEPKFLNYVICSHAVRLQIELPARSTSGVCNINTSELKALRIPLAPLAEQRRIVAKLELLMGKVSSNQKRLSRVPGLLKRFRQSVLAAACSGKLTADWRVEETAKVATVIRNTVTDTDLPEIPSTWAWIKLPQTGEMNRGKSRHRPRNEPSLYGGPYPFIQTGDIAQSGGRIRSHKQTYSEKGLGQSRFWGSGTVCITIAANIAESAILTYPACFPDSVVGIIANPDVFVAEFIEYFIRVAKHDLSTFAPATAQKNINIAILSELAVPLPPFAEQEEIVRRVEKLFAFADQIEARLNSAQTHVDRLTQSLLAKAFRGELVPTEHALAEKEGRDYEPASVLIERLRKAPKSDTQKPRTNRAMRKTT